MSTKITYNSAELKALMASQNGPVWRDLNRRADRVLNKARRLCPVDQGQLKLSLGKEIAMVNGVPVARIFAGADYAIYVHEGTGLWGRGQYIKPVKMSVLAWPAKNNKYKTTGGNRRYKSGKTANLVFSMRSKGVKGRPFLRNALDAGKGRVVVR